MQQWLGETVWPRHVVIFMVIFFAIDFTQQDNGSPLRSLWESAIIYFLFLLFSRTPLAYSIATFVLLAAMYILSRFIHYEEKGTPTQSLKSMRVAETVLTGIAVLIIAVGFVVYLRKQMRDHGSEWSTVDFMFGKPLCAHQSDPTPPKMHS